MVFQNNPKSLRTVRIRFSLTFTDGPIVGLNMGLSPAKLFKILIGIINFDQAVHVLVYIKSQTRNRLYSKGVILLHCSISND